MTTEGHVQNSFHVIKLKYKEQNLIFLQTDKLQLVIYAKFTHLTTKQSTKDTEL